MKIVHICLACFYVEGLEYQENILPIKHRKQGNEVFVLTSDYAFNSKGEATSKTEKEYTNKHGVVVKVLKSSEQRGAFSKADVYVGVFEELENIKPDIIFCHGMQFLDINAVIDYKKKYPKTKLFADNHGDYYNSGLLCKNKIKRVKRYFDQIIYWGHFARKFSKYAEIIYGVTPWRCQYLNDVYKIKKEKIGLLVMGGDDDKIDLINQEKIKSHIRDKHNIGKDDFVIVTGGKLDRTKNIHLLMEAVSEMKNEHVKLIVFGQPNTEMEPVINELAKNDNIRFIGWIPSEDAYNYFLASDLAVFPGTHSVLWEQACACGTPCVFKDWEGMHHIDVGGNCEFLKEDSAEHIKNILMTIIDDKEKYNNMKESSKKGIQTFSYKEIAKRAIGIK